jgi:pentatricopeptide repeat protein
VRRAAVLLLVLAFCPVGAASQNRPSDIKLRLAESYERSGNVEAALRLYEEMYARDTTSLILYEALRRSYLQLKKYDEVINLSERLLAKNPNDINLLCQLASVYVLKSEEPKAFALWERAIAVDPAHEATYRFVGSSLLQSRQFDRAIGVYLKGRTALGNPALFAPDLAYLYSIMMRYPDATREYVNYLRQNPPQLAFVQSRIASYTDRTDGLNAATQTVEQAAQAESTNLQFRQLLAWL